MVPLRVSGTNGTVIETYGLLDQGSEVTLIDTKLVEKLGLEGKTSLTKFNTFHKDDPTIKVKEVSFNVASLDGDASFNLENCFAVPRLNMNKREVDLKDLQQR